MKWTIAQLRKQGMPFIFEYNLDLNDRLDQMEDVKRIENCLIIGKCRMIEDDVYQFEFKLTATLYLECSVTLEEIAYDFNTEFTEIFGDEDSEYRLVDKNTFDLVDCVVTEIIISKPLKVVKEGYEDYYSDEEPKRENPFAALKDLVGGEDK